MNQIRSHESMKQRHVETSRERVEEMLRDIAFVLQMTRRVREEIEADEEAEEFALA
jgi:hypothetical protein